MEKKEGKERKVFGVNGKGVVEYRIGNLIYVWMLELFLGINWIKKMWDVGG